VECGQVERTSGAFLQACSTFDAVRLQDGVVPDDS
jgi:hypothetical protein